MPDDATTQIEKFKEFIETSYSKEINEVIKTGKKSLILDFSELSKFDVDLAEQLLNEPTEVIQNAEIAIMQMDLPKAERLKIRFRNLPESQRIEIRNIRSIHIDNLMVIEGIVRQSSDVRPQVVSAKFECPTCGNLISILQLDQQFREPSRCSCGRKGRFKLIAKELVDAQRLIIEEAPESLDGGEQPKRRSVFLKEDLVEPKMEKKTTPGSKILITGIIKEVPILLRTGAASIKSDLVIEANYIEPVQETFEDIDLTEDDLAEIEKLSKDPNLFKKLIGSIAPSIYGYPEIKTALLLQLFGGTRRTMSDKINRRGDIHILLIGDPGAGKSQLLQFISKIAPKGRFVSGKGSSGAGLTASVVRDEVLRGWALEAGAMVLANNGICAIDELDKMAPEDRSALHEAMEQQTVTIAKANIQATLRAQTTILAAANPKLGRFDPFTPIPSQIDLPPTLINRFDLVFPVRDLPNRDLDTKIATHILDIYQKPETLKTPVEPELLKKYIAYARQSINPNLTKGAIEEIKEFYVVLRNSTQMSEDEVKPIPISARQLEAMIRLAEASARLRLSKTVTKGDARIGISLIKYYLSKVGFDQETGQFDIDRLSTGIPASERGRLLAIKEIISTIEAKKGTKSIPIEDILMEALEKGIPEEKVEEAIEKLKRSGDLFEPKKGYLQKI